MEKLNLLKLQEDFCAKLTSDGKSFNTIKNYKTDLNIFNQFLISKGSKLTLNEISEEQLKEYSHFLEKKYNSPNSIRRRVQALRIFFDFLIQTNRYSYNPIKKILVSPKVVDKPNPPKFHFIKSIVADFYSRAELADGHSKLLSLRNLVLIHLIYEGGLKVSDIENVAAAHIKKSKGLYRILVTPEKKEPYMVSMPESFNELHEEYKKLLNERKDKDQVSFDNYLFNANPYRILRGGLSSRGIEVTFKEISKKHKTVITAKSLRQACIIHWLNQNKPESRIKELMGVQPKYSLSPYKKLVEEDPATYCYMNLV